jgi:hypothetical protein
MVGMCNRQAGDSSPMYVPGQARLSVGGVSMHSCVLLNPRGIPVVCQRSCKVSISDRTERAGRPAGRQLPVTGRTINKPDLSVQTPLRLCSKGPGTDPNSYTYQTTGLRSPAGKIISSLRRSVQRGSWARNVTEVSSSGE